MAIIAEKRGRWLLRVYTTVDPASGKPNASGPQGKPLKIQRSITLGPKDAVLTSKNSPALLQLAHNKAAEIKRMEEAVAAGEIRPCGDVTVADFYEQVFLPQMEKEKTVSTIRSYKLYWNAYLKEHFNHTKTLRGYESFTATNFLERLATTLSANTVMHARAVASAIFAYACAKGYIPANPWRDARKKIKCQNVEDTHAYSEAEVERILEALENVQGREKYSAQQAEMLVSVCFYAGCRPSEAVSLQWQNIDLNAGTIHICEATVNGKRKQTTKTEENRTVEMQSPLRNRLKLWHTFWQAPDKGLVFPNQSGEKPINLSDISARIIGPTLEKVGLAWHGLYACRRGFGTLLFESGATVEEIAANMGNSIAVAYKTYIKDKKRTAARGIAKVNAARRLAHESGPRRLREPEQLEAGV